MTAVQRAAGFPNPRDAIGKVFKPLALALVRDARASALAILTDTEGVHHMRVALRKLRTVLRVFREVYGHFWVEDIRGGLRAAADAAGAVRDEEVFLARVQAVKVAGRDALRRDRWSAGREKTLARSRVQLMRHLQSGLLEEPLVRLEALLVLPIVPGRDPEAGVFAAKACARAERAVRQRLHAARELHALHEEGRSPATEAALAEALHALRIGYKRVRYTHEIFAEVLPSEASARGKEAKKLQGWLGDVHDVDVARPKLVAAHTCPAAVRRGITTELEELARERLKKIVSSDAWVACEKAATQSGEPASDAVVPPAA